MADLRRGRVGNSADADRVAAFLAASGDGLTPLGRDVDALMRSAHGGLFVIEHGSRVIAALGFSVSGVTAHWCYCRALSEVSDAEFSTLIAEGEALARALGAVVALCQCVASSSLNERFCNAGYVVDYAEGDVVGGKPVTVVDLLKTLT